MIGDRTLDGLALATDGTPTEPVLRIDLDDWRDAGPADVARAVADVLATARLTIGVASAALPPTLAPLVESLTLTLTSLPLTSLPRTDRALVAVPDPQRGYDDLAAAIGANPRTAVALAQLLRQTSALPTGPGLAAEAAVYSMLLGGPEFTGWHRSRAVPARATPGGGDLVRLTRDGTTVSVVLDQPERRNAVSFALRDELSAALEVAVLDPDVSRVEVTGAGPVFCSGGDLAEFGTAEDLVAAYLVRIDRTPWRLLDRLRERLGDEAHVHVHGAAVGAGAEIAAFAGRLTSTPDAWFALPEVAMGLVPGAGGTVSVVRRVGRWRAAWMMLTGAQIDATTALAWGLVDQIEPAP